MTMATRNPAPKPPESPMSVDPTNDAPQVSVVMIGSSYNASNGEEVKVSAEQAASLIANGHAREPYAEAPKAE